VNAYVDWRLRRHGIDPDAIPEIQELRRRYQAGEDLTTTKTDRGPDRLET
jgi:hypothetical protein